MDLSDKNLEICLEVLQKIAEDPALIQDHERFKGLIAKIHKKGQKIERREARHNQRTEDQKLQATTALVEAQSRGLSRASLPTVKAAPRKLKKPVRCYICKEFFSDVHFFYHLLCPSCADLNLQKREQRANLTGRVALLTGGRIKIGYQTALRLLQDGARVIVTTRFPTDAARRFSEEPDFASWNDRLQILGLDLRNLPAVEALVNSLAETLPALDILINNAAQTIKRPLAFYEHLLAQEQHRTLSSSAQALVPSSGSPSSYLLEAQAHYPAPLPSLKKYFPAGTLDADGQQLDTRPSNSWSLTLDQVSTVEMLEVLLVNTVGPFLLTSRLKPLMTRSAFSRRFIIHVSAMEGQFQRHNKTVNHPHTNMAKAALNMLTRTAAEEYAQEGIFMNSVDTGWITEENPFPKKRHKQEEHKFFTPLDVIDGMARIYDPIVQGIVSPEPPLFGHFLKDYAPFPW
jgi:NAD(P)-dependent dehydrogenase (short-subunit alcohol dehydrogenase family)